MMGSMGAGVETGVSAGGRCLAQPPRFEGPNRGGCAKTGSERGAGEWGAESDSGGETVTEGGSALLAPCFLSFLSFFSFFSFDSWFCLRNFELLEASETSIVI